MQDTTVQSDQSKAGSTTPPSSKRDTSRTERTVWVALLALPLLTYCVVAVLTYSIKPTPINTGDALYDKYLAWVADDLVDNYMPLESLSQSRVNPRTCEVADPFGGWVQEFGHDPRYWMLRYRYSKSMEMDEWGFRKPDIRILERARKLGVTDGAILLVLLKELDSESSNEYDYYSNTVSNTMHSRADVVKYTRNEVDRQFGTHHNQLLAELMEVAGDESVAHYYAALCDTQRGDHSAALLHLENGNRAPSNSSLIGFPVERLVSSLRAGNPLADKLIGGKAIEGETDQLLPEFIQAKDLVNLLVADAVNRNDRAALDEIHTYACRYGNIGGGSVMKFLVGTVMVSKTESEFRSKQGSSLTVLEINNLNKLANLKAQVTNQVRAHGASLQVINPGSVSRFQEMVGLLGSVLSGGRIAYIEGYKGMYDYYSQEQSTLCNPIMQLFEQMETFNYNTLEFE